MQVHEQQRERSRISVKVAEMKWGLLGRVLRAIGLFVVAAYVLCSGYPTDNPTAFALTPFIFRLLLALVLLMIGTAGLADTEGQGPS